MVMRQDLYSAQLAVPSSITNLIASSKSALQLPSMGVLVAKESLNCLAGQAVIGSEAKSSNN
jgi:hypothetical protein